MKINSILKRPFAKRLQLAVVFAVLLFCVMSFMGYAEEKSDDIVILFENDVHCEIEGYSKLSAMKKELLQSYDHVGVVSSGDYIQGNSYGSISRGEYIIRLINAVGYDALALGNHEFDFKLDRLSELVDMMNTKPLSANFQKIGEDKPYFKPYSIVSYGDTKIAYIGITTPLTLTSSSTGQFINEDGEFIYTFNQGDLAACVQKQVDLARGEGADYVIALSHLGDREPAYNLEEVIVGVSGIDVCLDAHSHSVIESKIIKDKAGHDVLVSSTGSEFEYIGKLTISESGFTTELIKTEDYQKTDPEIDQIIQQIEAEFKVIGDRKVATGNVDLLFRDADGNRLVRNRETNLGRLIADAMRVVLDADIAFMNGGGMRSGIAAGDVTFSDLLEVMPYNNMPVVVMAKGQDILNMLEHTTREWPQESGVFPHLSGITFFLNISIPSSSKIDENDMFCGVDGEYRVYNVKILNSETGEYEPLDLEKTYKLAGQNHNLLEGGGGVNMFMGAEVVKPPEAIDVEIVERYLTQHLDGVIDDRYAEIKPNISITEGNLVKEAELVAADNTPYLVTAIITIAVSLVIIGVVVLIRKKYLNRDSK